VIWDIPGGENRVHLFSLDHYFFNMDQVLFYKAILDTIDPDDWICCLFHEPVYTGMTYKDGSQGFKDYVIPIFADHGADFVLNGHAHVYRRSHVLNVDGTVAEQTGGPGTSHISSPDSSGIVHIVNGRGGIFSDDTIGETRSCNAFAPTYTTTEGLVTLMEFTDTAAYIKTISIGDDYKQNAVIDEWTWTRGRIGPDTASPFFKSISYAGSTGGTQVTLNVVTNEDAYLRFSRTDRDYNSMTDQFTSGEGKKIHSTIITGQHGETRTYYVRAIDGTGNVMDASGIITFTVDTAQSLLTWKDPGYDFASWDWGQAQLGFGETPFKTKLFPTLASYFRTEFTINDTSLLDSLTMGLDVSGGGIIYLNGVEILRFNIPDGPVTYNTPANEPYTTSQFEFVDVSSFKNLLKEGSNLLAVELHQPAAGGNLVLDASLASGTINLIQAGSHWAYYDQNQEPPRSNTKQAFMAINKHTKESMAKMVRIYPNPFSTSISIKCSMGNWEWGIGNVHFGIYDINGRLVYSQIPTPKSQLVWDALNQASGIYFIKITLGQKTITRQVTLIK
jgi:hypothetical protein